MVVTDIGECKRNKNRVNVYADGEFVFACYLETALRNGVKKGSALSVEKLEEIKEEDGNKYALDTALKYVSAKLRTQKEIEDKLKGKQLEDIHIAYAIDKLREYGYIDDGRYAELYAQELSGKYGKKLVRMKLAAKGIDPRMADDMTGSGSNTDTLKGQVEKLSHRYRDEEPVKRKHKIVRSLLQKGFEYDEIKAALGGCDED